MKLPLVRDPEAFLARLSMKFRSGRAPGPQKTKKTLVLYSLLISRATALRKTCEASPQRSRHRHTQLLDRVLPLDNGPTTRQGTRY